jgi:hypothetical protein
MKIVERNEDMSRHGRLRLIQEDDGDIIVSIVPDPTEGLSGMFSAQFCTIGSGGGKSPKTLAALRALMQAMEDDNGELKNEV